jgi:hypothetical protein
MSSAKVRKPRMPEVENIVLRDALKDFGIESIPPGDDVVLYVERGRKRLFVTEAHKTTPREESEHIDVRDAPLSCSDLMAEPAWNGRPLLAEIDPMYAEIGEAFEKVCRENPDKAFDLINGSLARSAQMMAEIVEDTRRDLIDIAVRRERIDRTQEEISEILKHLFEDAPR